MISHITLFTLSVLMHGKTPVAGNRTASDAMRAVQAAWAWVETLPTKSIGSTSPAGDSNRFLDDDAARRDANEHAYSGGSFIVLANAGQSFVEEGDAEETGNPSALEEVIDEDVAPDADATLQGDADAEVDADADDSKVESVDADADAAMANEPVSPNHTQSVVSPVRYDNSFDEADAVSEDEEEAGEPLNANDIDVSFANTDTPPAEETPAQTPEVTSAEAQTPSNEEVGDDKDADFRDFGANYPMPGSAQPMVIQSTEPTFAPAANQVPTEEVPAPTGDTAAATNNGLTAQLRNGISIARMTLKDQPSELIRVSVNTSMVVDLSGPFDAANIVDPNVADIIVPSPNRVIVIGKSAGTTQLVLTIGQGQNQEHRVFHVYVEPNVVVLADLIRSLAPRSDVRIGSLNGQLVLQGNVPDALTAKQIEDLARAYQGRDAINHLFVSGTQQTLLRVVVAEVNKEALRNLGFNWAIGASDWSRDFFFANNVGNLNPTVFGSSGLNNVLEGQQLYGVAGVANGTNTNVTFGFPKAELQVFMNALRSNGLARTLAEPNLVAISGQTATFLAGGEVPIPVSQGGAVAGAITIEYKEFGVRLAFTPTVGADQIIRLHVMSEVSDAVPGSRQIDTIPVFTFRTRRVESTVECPNGKTFAIAGLLNESVNAIASKIPGLGDVPVLGQLFSSVNYQRSNTELVVLVTPNLVEALEPEQVPPPPGQMMQHPDDFELFGLGQLEGSSPPNRSSSSSEHSDEENNGTLVHQDQRNYPTHARLQGNWGMEEREPRALEE